MDHLPLQTRTCLFTDIVGSTFLKASLDPRTARAVFMRSIEIFKECLPPKDVEYDDSALQREAAGRIVSDTGDGVFAVFVSALDAVETALKVQWRMSRETWPTEQPVTIRIGLDVGDTTTRPDAVHGIEQPFGTVTDSAARVMSLGTGGQILLTQGVSYLISNGLRRHPFNREGDDSLGDLRLQLESHGNYRFKGDRVAEGARPLEVFEVRPVALGPCSRPDASEKCWPCDDSGQAVTGWRPLPGLEVPGTHPDKWVLEQRIGVGGFGAAWLAHNRSNAKQKRVFKFCYDLARARSFRREKKLFDLLNQALEKDPNLRANIAAIERSSMEATSSEGGPDPLPPYWVQSQHYVHGNLLEWALATYGTAEQQLTPEMTEEEQHACLCKALALIPEKVRLALWVELARTTHAVHQHGIIHRDLKPTNIFIRLDQDGTPHPVLADFGIGMIDDFARLEAAGFTRGGFLGTEFDNNSSRTGTRLYTPPEALRGEKPTAAWDIYALGVLLYQFVRGDASLPMDFSWDQQIGDSLLRADIGKGISDRMSRWMAADLFADSVSSLPQRRRIIESEELHNLLLEEQRAGRRKRKLLFILGLTTCIALGGWVFGMFQSSNARRQEAKAISATKEAQAALVESNVQKSNAEDALQHSEEARAARDDLIRTVLFDKIGGNTLSKLASKSNDPFLKIGSGLLQFELTIVPSIQRAIEPSLDALAELCPSKRIAALLIEPATGCVLAATERGDPTVFGVSGLATEPYEFGSLLSFVPIAKAIDLNLVSPDTPIFCENGDFLEYGVRILDDSPYGTLSVQEIIAKHSNIGVYKIFKRLGADRTVENMLSFGFGEKSDILLPSERSGFVPPTKNWSNSHLSSVPMGYKYTCTGLQAAYAMAVIANKGLLMKPMIIKSVTGIRGLKVDSLPEVRRQVISASAAEKMANCLEMVITNGTGKLAAVEGIRVAGKTGTAKRYDPTSNRYEQDRFVLSFVGFAPLEDPQILCLVMIDDLQSSDPSYTFGGKLCAPVFASIMRDALAMKLAIKPENRPAPTR